MNTHKQPFMAIHVNNLSLQEAADAIGHFINEKLKAYVVEVNTDVMIKIEKDPYLKRITNEADLVLIDGQPLVWIAKLHKRPIKEKVSGSDLSLELCRRATEKGHTMFILGGKEGILVASKIADRVGITRSVIVNALRKFESAGIIESRSSGMKGTYIKVLNDFIFEELEEIKAQRGK